VIGKSTREIITNLGALPLGSNRLLKLRNDYTEKSTTQIQDIYPDLGGYLSFHPFVVLDFGRFIIEITTHAENTRFDRNTYATDGICAPAISLQAI